MNVERVVAIGIVIAAGAAVLAGLFVLGSPAEERSRKLDARRVEDLQVLTLAMRRHYELEGMLPERIEDVVPDDRPIGLQDPRSGESYTYRRLDDETFELCASFEQPAEHAATLMNSLGMPNHEPFRFHDAGSQCFSMPASFSRPALKPGA